MGGRRVLRGAGRRTSVVTDSPTPRKAPGAVDPQTLSGSGARELALTDDLTGAHNRRFLRRLFEHDWRDLVERHDRVTLLVIDLDLFKEVNDRYGHPAGDVVLRAVAARLAESFRDEDQLVRWGGDEFVVVLPGAGPAEARALAERARRALSGDRWDDPLTGRPVEVPVSFSLGVASAPVDGASGETVLATADRRLYEEKKSRQVVAPRRRRRTARWLLALAGLAVVGLVAALVWLAPGESPAAVPSAAVFEARERARTEALRREQEMAALLEELEALRGRPAEGLSSEERERYEGRIRELERALDSRGAPVAHAPAAEPPAKTAPTPAPTAAVEPATGDAVAEERHPPGDRPAATAPAEPRARAWEPPQLISYDPPVYPPAARMRGMEAEVEVVLEIDVRGHVLSASLAGDAAGFGFDEAALVAARSARYRPARLNGRASPSDTNLRIVFRMNEGGRR